MFAKHEKAVIVAGVLCVALAAVLAYLLILDKLDERAYGAQLPPTASTGAPKPECQKISARKWNHLVRTERALDGHSRALRYKPVCRRTYKEFKRHVIRVKAKHLSRLEADAPYAIHWAFRRLGRVGQAMRVARCESTLNRFAENGQYRGLFQLGAHHYWRLGGLPYSHAYANAAAAAQIVQEDGGWGQWECRP